MDFSRITWRKSSRSADSANCVEVTLGADAVAARDSKNQTGPVLVFSVAAWSGFLATARGA